MAYQTNILREKHAKYLLEVGGPSRCSKTYDPLEAGIKHPKGQEPNLKIYSPNLMHQDQISIKKTDQAQTRGSIKRN